MAEDRVVRGEITFDEGAPAFVDATAHVQLEDVSTIDAPSLVVAEQVLPNTRRPPPDGRIEFVIKVWNVDERASYNVRALIDLDGDGKTSRGDFVTMQSYPVLTRSHPTEVSIRVRQVR